MDFIFQAKFCSFTVTDKKENILLSFLKFLPENTGEISWFPTTENKKSKYKRSARCRISTLKLVNFTYIPSRNVLILLPQNLCCSKTLWSYYKSHYLCHLSIKSPILGHSAVIPAALSLTHPRCFILNGPELVNVCGRSFPPVIKCQFINTQTLITPRAFPGEPSGGNSSSINVPNEAPYRQVSWGLLGRSVLFFMLTMITTQIPSKMISAKIRCVCGSLHT